MPDETWLAFTETADAQGYDGDAALAWDSPFAIVNEAAGQVIEVRKLCVELCHGVDVAQGFLGHFDLQRITAVSGGVALTPVKHVSSVADLPSQVTIVRRPTSVAINGRFRRFVPIGSTRAGVILSTFNFPRVKGDIGGRGASMSTIFNIPDTNLQPITLREGEGIALYQPGAGTVFDQRANCQIVVAATGATFTVPMPFGSVGPGVAVAAIFNGVGSGVVLNIRNWNVTDEAEANNVLPKYRVLHGPMKLVNGEDLTTVRPFVSSSAALPAGVLVRRNSYVRLNQFYTEPFDLGQTIFESAAGEVDQFNPMFMHQQVMARTLPWQAAQRGFPFMQRELLWDKAGHDTSKQGWTLRYGEGLAVVWGAKLGPVGTAMTNVDVHPSTFQNHNFTAVFTRRAGASAADIAVRRPQYHLGM